MSQAAADLLERSFKRTARGMIGVGIGVMGLGAFMIALDLFELDPETADMSTGMLVALYVFALLFVATGALMLYVGLVRTPRDAREIRALVMHSPEQIIAYWRWVATGTGNPEGIGSQNFVKIEMTTGKVHQVSVRKQDLAPILQLLGGQAPHADQRADEVQHT